MGELNQTSWSRIKGNNVAFTKDKENVGNGKPTGSVRKETIAVSRTMRISVQNRHQCPLLLPHYCFMQDAPGSELFTILDMLDVALGMMAAISVAEKGPATHEVSPVVEYLRACRRKKVICRIDGEKAPRTLAWQHTTPGAKKLSSSVDPSIPQNRWVRLRTQTRNSVGW